MQTRAALLHSWWQVLQAQGSGGFGPPGGYGQPPPNPYAAAFDPASPPPSRRSKWPWILLSIGGGLILLCGCCGAGGYFGFLGALNLVGNEVANQFGDHPVIAEHIGPIESSELDFGASIQEGIERGGGKGGQGPLVIHVQGPKGKGDIIGPPDPDGGNRLVDAFLRLPSGEEIPLTQ